MAEAYGSSKGKRLIRNIVIPVVVLGVALIGIYLVWHVLKKRQTQKPKREGKSTGKIPNYSYKNVGPLLPFFYH